VRLGLGAARAQHLDHPRIGLDRVDPLDRADQPPGHRPGAGPEVEHRGRAGRQQLLDHLGGHPDAVAVVAARRRAEPGGPLPLDRGDRLPGARGVISIRSIRCHARHRICRISTGKYVFFAFAALRS
jgi:hypothetical protein